MKRALTSLFEDPNIDEISPAELVGDYPALQYVPPHGRYSLDFLTRLDDAFTWADLDAGSEEVQLGNLIIRVAGPKMLYRMKKDTVRPQDRADAARIREAFDLDDS